MTGRRVVFCIFGCIPQQMGNIMKIKEIIAGLEEVFPPAYQEEYDNSGLQAGDPGRNAGKVLVTLDVTEPVIGEAIKKGCNVVISHHPLIFKGLKSLAGDGRVQSILTSAIKHDIAIYSAHTNLDNSANGLNAYLGAKLGLTDISILKPARGQLSKLVTFCPTAHSDKVRTALFDAGAGHIGNYDCCSYNTTGKGSFRASEKANPFVGEIHKIHFEEETRIEVIFPNWLTGALVAALIRSHPYEEVAYDIYPLSNLNPVSGSGITGILKKEADEKAFLEKVRKITGMPVVRHSAFTGKKVKKVGLCTGSGSFLIPEILSNHADVFLTADLKYHDFFEPAGRFLLADIGHFESEQFAKEVISAVLKEKFPTFAVLISETDNNPVEYL